MLEICNTLAHYVILKYTYCWLY